MEIQTKFFGKIDIKEEDIIVFPKGILGFEDKTKYIIINAAEEEIPFQYLQSVEDENLSFTIMNPFIFKKDYEFDIPKAVQELLQVKKVNDIVIYNIIVVPKDVNKMTANLAAPVIINTKTKLAKQMIIESSNYPVKFSILKALKEQNRGQNNAGIV